MKTEKDSRGNRGKNAEVLSRIGKYEIDGKRLIVENRGASSAWYG